MPIADFAVTTGNASGKIDIYTIQRLPLRPPAATSRGRYTCCAGFAVYLRWKPGREDPLCEIEGAIRGLQQLGAEVSSVAVSRWTIIET